MATRHPAGRSRQEMILKAAKELFYEKSFAAVGVDEIGERAGVTGPAIYRHFRGKDEILSTLFDDAIDRLTEATADTYADPWEELEALVRGHADFVLSERMLAGVKIREDRSLAEPFRRGLRRRERRYVERWLACLERCYPERGKRELTTATHVALGALNSVATWSPEAVRGADTAELIVAVVLRGLRAFGAVPVGAGATG
ncbi:MAG TPA: TetR/AcrR family transcriptional regulator [Solirubrobacteraceae bacterium]|jgi:AcrR family transcriptional regulator|nr:TetR/AcrR family transcriptional regulator [Solirubrobacteraceae bacterium]